MVNKRKIFVSCGEMSGDMHLSYIIEEMKKQDKELEFCGVVGDKSIKAGAIEVNHIKNNDIMGFVEVVKKYSYFKKKAFEYLEYIRNNEIDTVIFVDFGGFNLKFFELLKKNLPEIRTIYYIPPKVWAWGKKRIGIESIPQQIFGKSTGKRPASCVEQPTHHRGFKLISFSIFSFI